MNYQEMKKRLQAAEDILNDTKTSFEKFKALKTLVKGMSSKIDLHLEEAEKYLVKFESLQKGAVIDLLIYHHPENSEAEKKRKKLLLLFLAQWKGINSEVKRISSELGSVKSHEATTKSKITFVGKIAAFAKGPLGLITVIAVGIVILQSIVVKVIVRNRGCDSISLFTSPIPIPGMVLPKEDIPNGGSAVVKLPPISMTIDNTVSEQLAVTIFGVKKSFSYGRGKLVFDGDSLTGKVTTINLGIRRDHELIISCE